MVHRRPIDAMLDLLRAQRQEVELRSTLPRESPDWIRATDRLDDLNARIMQVADIDADRREPLVDGLDVALDSRPFEDVPFRRQVMDALRQASTVANIETLTARAESRVAAVADRVRATSQLIERARRSIRQTYPDATITSIDASESGLGAETLVLSLRADREGRIA